MKCHGNQRRCIQFAAILLTFGLLAALAWMYIPIIMCWDCSIPVSITTNPPLVDERGNQLLQCDNSTITLTCEANVTFVEPIYQWVSSLNYEKFDEGLSVIKVELRSSPVNYSCIVTDGYITGYANITIVSTGQKPVLTPINFNFNKFTQVGTQTDYNLTATFRSNPPLDSHPKWSFFYNRPVPGSRSYTSVYTNASSGVDYTVLTLSGLSLNDSGYYMVTASNLCGVSSLLVNVKVVRDTDRCLPGNTTIPPVVKGCMDRATINGELIIYKCSFKGNYNRFRSTMETFWSIESPEQPFTRIDEDRITNYHVTTYPDCITDSRSLCCQFTTELHINVSMFLDGANVSCWADIRNSSNTNNPKRVLYSSAKLVVLPRPLITIGLQDTVVRRNTSVQLECQFKAVTTERFTYFEWLKDDRPIDIRSSKYHFSLGMVPGTQHRMMTKLRIFEFTDEDQGKYSCYCKYNQLPVMRQIGVQREITSDISSANVILSDSRMSFRKYTQYMLGVVATVFVGLLLHILISKGPPEIIEHPSSGSIQVGRGCTLTCDAEGRGTLKYIWQRQESNRWINLDSDDSLSYTATTQGTYRCVVSNEAGSVESDSAEVKLDVSSQRKFSCLKEDARKNIFYSSYQELTRLPIGSLYDKLMAKQSLRTHLGEQITSLRTDHEKARHLLDAMQKGINLGISVEFESLLEAIGLYAVDNSNQLVITLFVSVQQRIEEEIQKQSPARHNQSSGNLSLDNLESHN